MITDDQNWNYDRILCAQGQMNAVQNDMSRVLFNRAISENTRDRMVTLLRHAADDLSRIKVEDL